MMRRDSNIMGLAWLRFASFVTKVYATASIFVCIVCIVLYRFIQSFFSFLNWLVNSPYLFLEVSLDTLYFLDLNLSNGLVRFIGFVTPRSEFFTILLYLILSVPLSLLKILLYLVFFLFRALSFFPWFLQVSAFAIFIPPLVYTYDLYSFIVYYVKISYYAILGWFYRALKVFVRSYLGFLELRLLRQSVAGGRRLTTREVTRALSTLGKRFHFEQFGSVSSSKVVNYYNNSGTFDLDKYFLGRIPFSVYFNGHYEHETGGLSSSHRLIHNARFFYQPIKKRRSLRLDYSFGKSEASLEEPIYNAVRVFEYHRYISMGLVHSFNFSSFPEYYRSKLFSRLLRFNLIPAVNFYYNIFSSTLRNRSKNPDFWVYYRRMATNPDRRLTWFEYSQSQLLKDPVFSYNNHDYTSPSFGRRLSSKLFNRHRFREISISEGLRSSFNDYRSLTDVSGRVFVGSHFSQFVDDYDHYLKTKAHHKSRLERFWFKRVLLPDSGLDLNRRFGLPALLSDNHDPKYKQQSGLFFRIVFIGFFGSIVGLYGLFIRMLFIFHNFSISFLSQLRQVIGDFLFRTYLSFLFFVLRLPSFIARGKRGFAPVYEFFTYPIKLSLFSVFWSFTVFSISLLKALVSISKWFYALICSLALRVYRFLMLPIDFIKFLVICVRSGNLESLVDNELDLIVKEIDEFIGWLLNDSDK